MKIFLAGEEHDAMLRRMVRSAAMPGHIQIAYEREPDFFHGLHILGTFNQVLAAEENGQISIMGCRSVRPMFINGEETAFGYLSGLRSSPAAKHGMGLVRGFRMFRELHGDGRCRGYLTTIIAGNEEAFATIAQGRAGLPFYKDLGEGRTYAVALNRGQRVPRSRIAVRFARPQEAPVVIQFLRREGRQRQFFPALRESDFGTPLLRNLSVTDFLIAEINGQPCGVGAVWDQTAFKQHRIRKYSRAVKRAKPLIDAALKLGGYRPLPGEGDVLNSAFFGFKAARDNDPEIHAALLRHACIHLQQAGATHCIAGFHESDPAQSAMQAFRCTVYRSRLFFAGWEEDLETYRRLDGRIPYFDPAIL